MRIFKKEIHVFHFYSSVPQESVATIAAKVVNSGFRIRSVYWNACCTEVKEKNPIDFSEVNLPNHQNFTMYAWSPKFKKNFYRFWQYFLTYLSEA